MVNMGMILLALGAWGWYKFLPPLDPDMSGIDRFLYVLTRTSPTLIMQWVLFECVATYRTAFTQRGEVPFPYEDITRAGPGKPIADGAAALNPPFHAQFIRAVQNRFESTVINLLATLVLSQYCYGPKMYDARLAAVFGYLHALGSVAYVYGYSMKGNNYRMFGFIFSGFWNNMSILLFCFLRLLGLGEEHPGSLCLWCLFGWPGFNLIVLIVVKVKYLSGPEANAQPFGFDTSTLGFAPSAAGK